MIHPFTSPNSLKGLTHFTKEELATIIALYSKRVSQGEWRDYALDHQKDMAMFSIFRHTAEHPLYTITKHRGTKNRATQFQANHGVNIINKSNDLKDVIEKLSEYKKG